MNQLWIYGDSILRGVTYSTEKRAHTLWSGHRLEEVQALDFAITNRSRMGATSADGLQLLTDDIRNGLLPPTGKSVPEDGGRRILLLEYGGNDSDFDWQAIARDPDGEFHPKTAEKSFCEHFFRAIALGRSCGMEVRMLTMIPLDAERYLRWVSQSGGYDGILRWLGDVSAIYRFAEHYNRLLEEIARRENCPLIDTREVFLLSRSYKDLLCADGIHPTEAGYRLIRDTLCRALQTPAQAAS